MATVEQDDAILRLEILRQRDLTAADETERDGGEWASTFEFLCHDGLRYREFPTRATCGVVAFDRNTAP